MMAMAARPGAVDKAYIVGSSFFMRLEVLSTSAGSHGWTVSYPCFFLTLEAATGLDEYARRVDACAREFA